VDEFSTGPAVIRATRRIPVTTSEAGVVRTLEVVPGDHVRKGDVLAQFQSAAQSAATETPLRAPATGVVSDLHLRAAQAVAAGEPVASILDETAGYDLIAFLPGNQAVQLRPGMQLELTPQGYADSRHAARIDRVGEQILSPREVAQYMGEGIAVPGPVVVVRCHLASSQFHAMGSSYGYRDGMPAVAEVKLRSQPMIYSLLPGFKEAVRRR
jgi:multidrug resistance efflux pump